MDPFALLRKTPLFYGAIYQFLTPQNIATMNYGFSPLSGPVASDPAYAQEPHQIEMYRQTFRQLTGPLSSEQLLCEISCGRGGGLNYLRAQTMAQVLGLEPSAAARRYARKQFSLDVRRAVAPHLPLADDSVDVFISVEAMHKYRNRAFAAELARCLKPGGYFLLADRGPPGAPNRVQRLLQKRGFEVSAVRDVTANVLDSLREDEPRKLALLDQLPGLLQTEARRFTMTTDSKPFKRMQEGRFVYFILQARNAT